MISRLLLRRSLELIRSQRLVLGVLTVWAFAPLAASLLYIRRHGGVLTGANGWDPYDQFQYLSWTRDAGAHWLASNLWGIGPAAHDYLQPMYVISGLLWRIGVSLQVAYVAWKPIAILVLFLGYAAYVRDLLPGSRRQQTAALALALFYVGSQVAPALAVWTGGLSSAQRGQLALATNDADPALQLWGIEHTAIAVGLMPVFLIAVDRLLSASAADRPAARRWAVLASAAGLLVSWLHPWQGAVLLGVIGGLVVLHSPRRRYLALIPPVAATLVPLIYSLVLSRADAAWRTFSSGLMHTAATAPWWALLSAFGPLSAFALLGGWRPRDDREWMLVLWVPADAVIYLTAPVVPSHVLSGVTLPLAILASRGWQRLRLAPRVATPAAIFLILAFTVPPAVYLAQRRREDLVSRQTQLFRLTADQAAALDYIDRSPRSGGVLAMGYLSLAVPVFTGRQTYAGHGAWQRGHTWSFAAAFFSSALTDPGGTIRRTLLTGSGARFVLADCGAAPQIASDITSLTRRIKRFGCVTVYEVSPLAR